MAIDTFDRGCDDRSEDGRRGMGHFCAIANLDYDHLANARTWRGWLADKAKADDPRPLRLLDVTCGPGKRTSGRYRICSD